MMTHPQPVVHSSELCANLHAPVVLPIFQDRPSSLAAQFVVMKTSRDTSTASLRLLVSSTVAVHENERDLLENTVYLLLVSLWSEFSDAYPVFDKHSPAQLLCDQQVWDAPLAAFPLKHKCMQTVLLAREIGRLMTWDCNSKNDINPHFGKVGKIRLAFKYIDTLTLTTFFSLSFWLHSNPPTTTPSAPRSNRSSTTWTTTRTSPLSTSNPSVLANFGSPRSHTLIHLTAAFLCNTLEKHGEQPGKVLCRACLAGAEWNEPASVTSLFKGKRASTVVVVALCRIARRRSIISQRWSPFCAIVVRQQVTVKLFEGVKGGDVASGGICKILTSNPFGGMRE
jgi:hypothetical protein